MKKQLFLMSLMLSLFILVVSCPNEQEQPLVKDITTPIVVEGKVGTTITPISITVELEKGKFKAVDKDFPVSAWFNNVIVSDLEYKIKEKVKNGAKLLTIEISGTPKSESITLLNKITIPKDRFVYATGPIDVNLPSGSKYNIVDNRANSWHLYDLASFGDTSLSVQSENKMLTKAFDGSDLEELSDGKVLLGEGSTSTVTFEKGLSRRGYKLAGFNRHNDSTKPINTDLANLDYKVGTNENDVKIDSSTGAISFKLKDSDFGEGIHLYAIWERDTSSPYFKEAMNITITKSQVDVANPDDTTGTDAEKENYASLKDLKMHDGTTELDSSWTQVFSFIALPGGRIGGTESSPVYFKWPVAWTSNNNPTTYANIMSDFAISDMPLTPALWNVVYAWATSNDRGNDKYTFMLDRDALLLAGADYNKASSESRHSAEDPLVRVCWYNSVIFANALTEWYNAVVATSSGDEKLTVAYTSDGSASGTPLRDATNTSILNKINSGENNTNTSNEAKSGLKRVPGATGFRLPSVSEWQYAASVLPSGIPSDWDKNVNTHTKSGMMYPFCQNYAYASGVDGGIATTNTKLKDYCVYKELYAGKEGYGTQTVGKYFVADSIRTNGAKPNALGLYDMSGNVWEWAEEWYGSNIANRILVGDSSWFENAYNLYVGYITGITPDPTNSYSTIGVRFCRTLSSSLK